jgi:hypothetical protein
MTELRVVEPSTRARFAWCCSALVAALAMTLSGCVMPSVGAGGSSGALPRERAALDADATDAAVQGGAGQGAESTPAQVRRTVADALDGGPAGVAAQRLREAGLEPWVVAPRYALVKADAAAPSGDEGLLTAVRVAQASQWSVQAWRAAPPRGGPEVGGDPDAGAIVAEGSVLLPGDFVGDDDARAAGSDCPGCRWRLDLACPQQGDLCAGALVGCAPGDLRYVVRLLRPPSTEFAVIGTLCRGPGEELLAVDVLAERVRDRFVELLPRAAPAVQPSSGLLVQVPAVFRSGEPATIGPIQTQVSGYAVTLQGRAEWTWRFGDGATLVTTSPGGRFPDTSVSHVFGRPGRFTVDVATTWNGEFLVDGRGPYPVAGGPITLNASLPLPVQEARAVLVAP